MLDPVPQSPCVNVCVLDEHGYCLGCYRTIEEIAGWSQLSRFEKFALLDRLDRRALRPDSRITR
jgi:predicted Fe-S protein YdhL (DUF1289 family)